MLLKVVMHAITNNLKQKPVRKVTKQKVAKKLKPILNTQEAKQVVSTRKQNRSKKILQIARTNFKKNLTI